MSNAARLDSPMTVEEFQNWVPEPGLEGWRWQLIDGTPVSMAPTSNAHGAIQSRTSTIIDMHLQKLGRCIVITTPGVIPKKRSKINQLVPDLGVSCTDQPMTDNTIRNPILLVEILSPSNEGITRGNVYAYQTIPSVQEILVLNSRKVAGTLHRRDGQGEWPDDPDELDAQSTVELRCIDLKIALAAFYGSSGLVGPASNEERA